MNYSIEEFSFVAPELIDHKRSHDPGHDKDGPQCKKTRMRIDDDIITVESDSEEEAHNTESSEEAIGTSFSVTNQKMCIFISYIYIKL